jgi:hypothetical protein
MHTFDADKAAHLDAVLDDYNENKSGDMESAVKDILTDLMHVCGREGFDFNEVLESSRMMFDGEVFELNAGDPLAQEDGESGPEPV